MGHSDPYREDRDPNLQTNDYSLSSPPLDDSSANIAQGIIPPANFDENTFPSQIEDDALFSEWNWSTNCLFPIEIQQSLASNAYI
jgi:hypothetical protein